MTSSALQGALSELKSFGTIKKCLNNTTKLTQSFSSSTFQKAANGTSRSITFSSKREEKTVVLTKNDNDSYNIG